jgi:hypothetical protein
MLELGNRKENGKRKRKGEQKGKEERNQIGPNKPLSAHLHFRSRAQPISTVAWTCGPRPPATRACALQVPGAGADMWAPSVNFRAAGCRAPCPSHHTLSCGPGSPAPSSISSHAKSFPSPSSSPCSNKHQGRVCDPVPGQLGPFNWSRLRLACPSYRNLLCLRTCTI